MANTRDLEAAFDWMRQELGRRFGVTFYLSAYWPLCLNAAGRLAITRFGHPPFVDASIRREPDFESRFPSISAICHGSLFAPKLQEHDRVVFLTVKGAWGGPPERHWRLVAAVEILKRFESHRDAATWYQAQGLPLPGNCMVPGNQPLAAEHSIHPNRDVAEWDAKYAARVVRAPVFLASRSLFFELSTPPVVTEAHMIRIMGRIPGLRNPPEISDEQFAGFLDLATKPALVPSPNRTVR